MDNWQLLILSSYSLLLLIPLNSPPQNSLSLIYEKFYIDYLISQTINYNINT